MRKHGQGVTDGSKAAVMMARFLPHRSESMPSTYAAHDRPQREHDTDRPHRMRIEVVIALQGRAGDYPGCRG